MPQATTLPAASRLRLSRCSVAASPAVRWGRSAPRSIARRASGEQNQPQYEGSTRSGRPSASRAGRRADTCGTRTGSPTTRRVCGTSKASVLMTSGGASARSRHTLPASRHMTGSASKTSTVFSRISRSTRKSRCSTRSRPRSSRLHGARYSGGPALEPTAELVTRVGTRGPRGARRSAAGRPARRGFRASGRARRRARS